MKISDLKIGHTGITWPEDEVETAVQTIYMKAFHDAGGKIVSGTDAFMDEIPAGISLHETLQIMVEAGLTPYEALKTATVNPANMLEINERIGTIEVGKEADFILLGGNPLEDIANTLDIHGVMTKGRWLDTAWIEKKWGK